MRVEQRRRLLAEAAMRVMRRDGVGAATTRAVTAEAGMPHGAFHYCFRSKDELLKEVFRSDADAALDAAFADLGPSTDLRECVTRALEAFWADTTADRDGQLALEELATRALRDPELARLRSWQVEAYTTRLAEQLTALSDRTGTRWSVEPRVLAGLLYSVLSGITVSWLALGEAAAAQEQLALLAVAVTQLAEDDAA